MTTVRPFISSLDLLPAGLARTLCRPLHRGIDRLLHFTAVNDVYAQLQRPGITAEAFCTEALGILAVDVQWPEPAAWHALRDHAGPLLIMANHPYGAKEALALMLLLDKIRPGAWRMMANGLLSRITELQPNLIAVDPLRPQHPSNRTGMIAARRHLQEGGLLAVFPAGRVSGRGEHGLPIADLPWSDHPARLAAKTGASVALIHFPGGNSQRFLDVPTQWPRLRGLALAREITQNGPTQLQFHIGPIIEPATVLSHVKAGNPGARFRARCYQLQELTRAVQMAVSAAPPAIAPSGPVPAMCVEVTRLCEAGHCLFTQGKFHALYFQKHQAPQLFHELARQRELTFRHAGQGSGSALDDTPEDTHYHQLVLWDHEAQRLAGAYRLAFTADVIARQGQSGLYLDHIFHISPDFFTTIGPAVELTRSFLNPDYQKEPLALAALWKGLGKIIVQRGDVRCLFGSVTIPASMADASRAILVDYLRRHHADHASVRAHIRPRAPFHAPGGSHHLILDAHRGDTLESLRDAIRTPTGQLHPIPPLIRHYLALHARFIDFHVESHFGDALYCFLRADLTAAPLSHLRRFLGDAESAAFLRRWSTVPAAATTL